MMLFIWIIGAMFAMGITITSLREQDTLDAGHWIAATVITVVAWPLVIGLRYS